MTTSTNANAASKGGKSLVFHWFRLGDMRLHDNPALQKSILQAGNNKNIVPVFCFDPRIFGNGARSRINNELKCGPKRAQFVLESVADLRRNLERKGSGLLVAHAKPEDFLDQLFQQLGGDDAVTNGKVICQEEVCSEEQDVVKAVDTALRKRCASSLPLVETVWGSTLYNIEDLPYQTGLADLPDSFTPFRNKVEKKCEIQTPFAAPNSMKLPFAVDSPQGKALQPHLSYMPTLQDLGYTSEQMEEAKHKSIGNLEFVGGETAALARVENYIWTQDRLQIYFDTRNGMLGDDYSSKLAPWLAHGNVSPRFIAKECKRYEQERVENKSTYWLVFELLWRDFFKFFALKHGTSLFFPGGTVGNDKKWHHYEKNLQAWKEGKTGFPLVDANMRELAASGFMSNRGRQNVCSFLALELNQDWRYGAEYFENILVDYDVYSNWGNWASGAGMTGGRLNRFNIVKQSKDYDQRGDYVRHWLPELKNVPIKFVHEPWKMTQFQQMEYGCKLGVDYPNPIAKPYYPQGGGKGGNNKNGAHKGRGNNNRNKPNPNRGRGQKQDMKSLKEGKIHMK
ncbi:Cryptochrome DASH [Seminavis robusta]|uniref:Cryptochrome DASH n=1 Tax=Seminavis robusta TaxID=568900 RepID=A0A9N8F029_9STRA|nr:Cryptochrome DASH [Seminavis robusta]|eukprot:Sro2726_g335660.1 Cryptochrome DASH (567) ;mRNA; f:6517-8336